MLMAQDIGLEREALLLSPLQLAYIGDTVWDLMVRTALIRTGKNLHNMHCAAVARVNAKAQAQALNRLSDKLTLEEADMVRRGRNAHPRHGAPKNQDPAAYSQATGLETLIGYLYLTGHHERLQELYKMAQPEEAIS
jgi:ribonuclease III family protein